MNNFENIVIVCFIYYYTWLTCHWRPLSSAGGSRHQSIFNQNIHVYGIIRPAIFRNVANFFFQIFHHFRRRFSQKLENSMSIVYVLTSPVLVLMQKCFGLQYWWEKPSDLPFLSKKDKKSCTKKGFFKSKIITCISAWVQTYVVKL